MNRRNFFETGFASVLATLIGRHAKPDVEPAPIVTAGYSAPVLTEATTFAGTQTITISGGALSVNDPMSFNPIRFVDVKFANSGAQWSYTR